jgi:hypothetical protein
LFTLPIRTFANKKESVMDKNKSAWRKSVEKDKKKREQLAETIKEILNSNDLELVCTDTFDWGVRNKGGDIVYFFKREGELHGLYKPTRHPIPFPALSSLEARTPSALVARLGLHIKGQRSTVLASLKEIVAKFEKDRAQVEDKRKEDVKNIIKQLLEWAEQPDPDYSRYKWLQRKLSRIYQDRDYLVRDMMGSD